VQATPEDVDYRAARGLETHRRRFAESRGQQRPGFAGSRRARHHGAVGNEGMPRQIKAKLLGIGASAFGQDAVMVAPARLQTFGLGMAQQQQAAHGSLSPDFSPSRIFDSTLT
jgi:hypothetical protein